MLLTSLKWVAFSAIILLLGQIPIGPFKIGEKFYGIVQQAVTWSGREIKETKVYASFSSSTLFSQWLNSVYPPQVSETSKPQEAILSPEAIGDAEDIDTFTATDRESILRLLD